MFSCLLDMSLGLLHSVPDWVKAGDFGIISTSWGYEPVSYTHLYFPYAVLKVYMKSPGINFLDFFAI